VKRHPRVVAIRWQQAGDGDDVRQMERPMRDGIDPLREARSLAQRSAIPRGTIQWRAGSRMKRCKFVDGSIDLSTLEYLDELSSTWRRAYEIPTGAEECWLIASKLN